ncbi:MAG: DUF6814 family protein [Cyclobacteriaceae bacterium]
MNAIKQVIGFISIPGALVFGYLIVRAGMFIGDSAGYIVASIIIIAFSPVAVGLLLFGYYALRGEYNS